jgi:hypothetical protein
MPWRFKVPGCIHSSGSPCLPVNASQAVSWLPGWEPFPWRKPHEALPATPAAAMGFRGWIMMCHKPGQCHVQAWLMARHEALKICHHASRISPCLTPGEWLCLYSIWECSSHRASQTKRQDCLLKMALQKDMEPGSRMMPAAGNSPCYRHPASELFDM